jgi:hypothetical protein
MEIAILGYKMRVEIVILCIMLGWFVAVSTFCSCCGGIKEGFQAGTQLAGAALKYHMGQGVKGSYETDDSGNTATYNDWFKGLDGNTGGKVPLPEGQLAMFYDNIQSPSCCGEGQGSTYSGSMGCVCVAPEQMKYLNERGGNRTFTTEY